MSDRVCSIDGCDRDVCARGWCQLHWQRWRRTGDPEGSKPRGPRRDAWQHGSRRGFEVGCRCFPCRRAANAYQRAHREGRRSRVDGAVVADHLRSLVASGWSLTAIADEAGVGRTTPWYIASGRNRTVNGRTAAALFAVEPLAGPVELDAAPLVDAVLARGLPLKQVMDDADRRTFYRAKESGRITDRAADRIAVRACGLTLDEVYGPGWDVERRAS